MVNAAGPMPASEGWSARLQLGFQASPGKTLLAHRQRHGPLAVQRPFYPEGDVCHVYLLHPPGGVVGGDSLHIEAHSAAASHALITTPGATKFYRSAGSRASQVQRISVADGASLEWLPQENIFFPGASVEMHTRIDLEGSARLALWETHCLGRPVIEEGFDEGDLDSRLEVWRDGKPLLLERLRVDAANRRRLALLGGRPVSATAVFACATAQQLELAREALADVHDHSRAVTLIDDLLVVRYLGNSTEQAGKCFTRIWSAMRRPLLGRSATVPRIWNT